MSLFREKLGVVAVVLAFVFCSLFFPASFVSAAVGVFKIQDVTVEATNGEITDFGEDDIASNATLGWTGEFAKYTITIRNTDSVAHIVEDITDDNSNPYITYEYDSHTNEQIEPGADLILVVIAKYTTYITDIDDRIQDNSVSFQIHFSDIEEEIVVPSTNDELVTDELLTPDTGNSTSEKATALGSSDDVVANVIMVALLVFWFAVVILPKRRNKNIEIILPITFVLLGISAFFTSSTVQAAEVQTDEFTLNTTFTLELGRIIHYDGNWEEDGEMEDERLTSDGTLSPNAYSVGGYHFTGWSLVVDEEVVFGDEEPMANIPGGDEPLTLFAYWEPNVYTVVFHANSEEATSSMDPIVVTYDSFVKIPENKFVREGYYVEGWKIDNEGELLVASNHIGYFEVEHGATVNLYAQWKELPAGIDYYGNGSDVLGTTKRQAFVGKSMRLQTPNYRRDGYGFAGWNTEPDGTGIMYGTNETISTPTEGLKLYATWVESEEDVTMQTFDSTAEPYASAPINTVIALGDTRDGQVYTVAKLADEKWWMTENLRLSLKDLQITAENTNNPTEAFMSTTPLNYFCTESSVACINQTRYGDRNLNATMDDNGFMAYGYGVYYNAFAATAGHAAVDPDNSATGQVEGDICPKGWHLPSSGNGGDFKNLDISLGGTGTNSVGLEHAQKYFKPPINFVGAGWVEGSSYRNAGSDAIYLEKGTSGVNQKISTYVDVAAEMNGAYSPKNYGYTVRCLAD